MSREFYVVGWSCSRQARLAGWNGDGRWKIDVVHCAYSYSCCYSHGAVFHDTRLLKLLNLFYAFLTSTLNSRRLIIYGRKLIYTIRTAGAGAARIWGFRKALPSPRSWCHRSRKV